jgi:hypothetical protein
MTHPFVDNLAAHLKDIPEHEVLEVINQTRKLLDEVEEPILYPSEGEPESLCGLKPDYFLEKRKHRIVY